MSEQPERRPDDPRLSVLVVETAPGAGTKVIVRVPKFARGVSP